MAWEYTEKTKQLFIDALSNKAGTHLGIMENPDAIGEDGSIVCGDAMKIFLKIEKHPTDFLLDKIVAVKYQTFGCTSAIASSEALCAMIEAKKMTPLEALKITNQDIVDYLGGLPEQKIHCSVMGAEALGMAIKKWASKRGVDLAILTDKNILNEKEDDEGRLVCRCFHHSDIFLKKKIKEMNLRSVDDIINATKAGGGCGGCIEAPGGIRDLLREVNGNESNNEKPYQCQDNSSLECDLTTQIENTILSTIRPTLQSHGGDIEIIKIKNKTVYCTLTGACSSCAGAQFTLKNSVEKQLQKLVDKDIKVIDI